MTIASEITRINNNIQAAYSACSEKGATMPANQNSANLADCISSITTGGSSIPDLHVGTPLYEWTLDYGTGAKNVYTTILRDSASSYAIYDIYGYILYNETNEYMDVTASYDSLLNTKRFTENEIGWKREAPSINPNGYNPDCVSISR